MNDDATRDEIGVEIASAADAVEVGDPAAMLTKVHTTVRRRRRRRNAIVGLAAAGALGVSAVVVANVVGGGEGDDRLVSAPATEAPTTDPEEPAETPPSTEVDTGSAEVVEVPATEVVPVRLVPAESTDVVDPGLTVDVADAGQSRLLAWNDGFLSIRTTYPPQPLPAELPAEIADQFPPEVVELFPDGLPPTINEAIAVLQEAGLLDEVSDIVTANQDVYDAIYAEQSDVETTVRFSVDGLEWTDVPVDFPVADNYWAFAGTTSDRMVIVSESGGLGPGPDAAGGPGAPRAVEVSWSTDLVEWTSQRIPFPEAPGELGPSESFQPYLSSIAVTDNGFIVAIEWSTEVDPLLLVPPDVRDRVRASGGYGASYGEDGVTIEIIADVPENPPADQPPEPVEVLTFTWDELGLDGPPNAGPAPSTAYVSTWDGEPTVIDDAQFGWLVGLGDEFLELGPQPRRSTNGIDWTPIATPGDGFVDGIVETPDGVAIRMSDERGTATLYEGDLASGMWTPIELPDVPESIGVASWGPNVFVLAQYDSGGAGPGPEVLSESIGSRQRAEVEGYVYELVATETAEEYSVTYTLTDVATSEVVVTESADGLSEDDDPFEFVHDGFGGDSVGILDPATGELLVSIPFDAMTTELLLADGSTVDVSEPTEEPSEPSHWVMASIDDGWMVEQISDGSVGPEEGRWPSAVAGVGDVVLVAWSDGTLTRVTPA